MTNTATNVDEYLQALPEWQKIKLTEFRTLIHHVAPEVTEEIKWNVPTFFVDNKMYFAMAAFKEHVKYNFILNGALLNDKDGLFNNGLDSKKNRSIDIRESESVGQEKLRQLLLQSLNI